MNEFDLKFYAGRKIFPMIFVEGTRGHAYSFGNGSGKQEIHLKDFFISKFTVTQEFWKFIMGFNPANFHGDERPIECVSFNDIVGTGFLMRLNSSSIMSEIRKLFPSSPTLQFRLPSEAEWEYAARGGRNWKDNFIFSGSNRVEEVAWYRDNSQNETKPVGQKRPNQLGICDMSGNIWEWCQDFFTRDTNKIPKDGSAYLNGGAERVLRGGCHHNWDEHCSVTKRYEIAPEYKDPCIGLRLVLEV